MKKYLIILCLFITSCATTSSSNHTSNYNYNRDVIYAQGYTDNGMDTKDLLLDMMEPKIGVTQEQSIVLVHGGSFKNGSRRSKDLVKLSEQMCDMGYRCFLVDYRLEKDKPPVPSTDEYLMIGKTAYPATVDVKTAIKAIRVIYPNELILVGESAGAVISYSISFADDDEFIKDPGRVNLNDEYVPMDGKPARVVGLWGSCMKYMYKVDKDDPPVMILHGSEDLTTGASIFDSTALYLKCKSKNLPSIFYPIPGKEHGAWDAEVNGKDIAALIDLFIKKRILD